MLRGERVIVRPMKDEDVPILAAWTADVGKTTGDYQRYQLEHGRMLTTLYAQNGLISRESGFLIIELAAEQKPIGFVRYTAGHFPDPDIANIDVGYGIAEPEYRGKGYAGEALALLLDYIFAAYPVERVSAYTDPQNIPSRRLLERLGFICEGTMRSAIFHHGDWRDLCIYGILRREWVTRKG
jgi:aminoglycoside 6'-N-acetyltransferase